MKIVCLGGGPAGLYFSIIAKKADPSCDITVIERNSPDNTFGWGVVFSDKTMAGFRHADPETHAAITDAFRHWDDIDVHFKGRTITYGELEIESGGKISGSIQEFVAADVVSNLRPARA